MVLLDSTSRTVKNIASICVLNDTRTDIGAVIPFSPTNC
jgi:hypothetical protein